VEAVDSTGAGDCFVGGLAASLWRGADMADALRFANLAASISVQRPGAGPSMPSLADVNAATQTP
jgi:ribokinase